MISLLNESLLIITLTSEMAIPLQLNIIIALYCFFAYPSNVFAVFKEAQSHPKGTSECFVGRHVRKSSDTTHGGGM